MAKLVFIVSPNFRDAEFFDTKAALGENFEVEVASTQTEEIAGADEGKLTPNLLIENIDADNYDGIVIVGGPGMYNILYEDTETTGKIIEKVKAFNSAGKLVAAICVSPVALAKANVVFGKNITSWDSKGEQEKELTNAGAVFKKENVVQDGNIITANGPRAAGEFGNKIREYFGVQ